MKWDIKWEPKPLDVIAHLRAHKSPMARIAQDSVRQHLTHLDPNRPTRRCHDLRLEGHALAIQASRGRVPWQLEIDGNGWRAHFDFDEKSRKVYIFDLFFKIRREETTDQAVGGDAAKKAKKRKR